MMDGPSHITVTFNNLPTAGPYRFQLLVPALHTDESIEYFHDCAGRTTLTPTSCGENGAARTVFYINHWKREPRHFQIVAHVNGRSYIKKFSVPFEANQINRSYSRDCCTE
jgi:hypothetical protein